MAVIIPSTVFVPRTIHLGLSKHDRRAIEAQIETLIELLDTLDGDADLEDDELNDDILDTEEGSEHIDYRPMYGVDQSLGPINEAAFRDYVLVRRFEQC